MSRKNFRASRGEALPPRVATFLEQAGIHATAPRWAVVRELLGAGGHVTREELILRLRHRRPRVSSATVYRVMHMLVACGFAVERTFGDASQFEVRFGREEHDHLVCSRCGHIVEFTEPSIERAGRAIAERFGYALVSRRLELHGVCRACARPSGAQLRAR